MVLCIIKLAERHKSREYTSKRAFEPESNILWGKALAVVGLEQGVCKTIQLLLHYIVKRHREALVALVWRQTRTYEVPIQMHILSLGFQFVDYVLGETLSLVLPDHNSLVYDNVDQALTGEKSKKLEQFNRWTQTLGMFYPEST